MVLAQMKPQLAARYLHIYRQPRLERVFPVDFEAEKTTVKLLGLLNREYAQDWHRSNEGDCWVGVSRGIHDRQLQQKADRTSTLALIFCLLQTSMSRNSLRGPIMICLLVIMAVSALGMASAQTPSPTANQIMERVAGNQDRSQDLRRHYIYKQHVVVVSRKTNGKLMQEEASDYLVVPEPQGSTKKLARIAGRYWQKHEYVSYSGLQTSHDGSLDGDLVSDLRDDLVNERHTKDGLAADLFPLTTKEQEKYRFNLLGEQAVRGRKVYRIGFWPKNSDIVWKGEALIDADEFQPVTIFTRLARRVPFWVRTALGTDFPELGFSVTYSRQPDGVWFPVSFGTEFRLRAVFFIHRDITISLRNTDFEKTHVDSVIHYAEAGLPH